MAAVGRGQAVFLELHHPICHFGLPQHRVHHNLERIPDLGPGRSTEVDAAFLVDRIRPGRWGRPAGAGVGGLQSERQGSPRLHLATSSV